MAKDGKRTSRRTKKEEGDRTSPQTVDDGSKDLDQTAAARQFPIPPKLVEHLLLGSADDRRVLQDSPILGDVWLAYAADPASRRDLLITPHKDTTAAAVAAAISAALGRKDARLA